jgi:hypothetical protein
VAGERGGIVRSLALLSALAVVVPAAAGCTGGKDTQVPTAQREDALGQAFSRASEAEQLKPADQAMEAYLALIDSGMSAGDEGVRAVLAGLDALVWRETLGLGRVGGLHALAFRTPGGLEAVERRLTAAVDVRGSNPLARGFVAQALLDLARFRGDVGAATAARQRTGSAARATVVGPLSWSPLGGVEAATALEEGPVRESYPGVGPFAAQVKPWVVEAEDAVIDASAVSVLPGLYAVVVDVDSATAQRAWLTLLTTASAVLVVGGKVATTRPYSLGGGPVLRMATAELPAGKTRVVVRLGANEDGARLSLGVVGADGAPLPLSAPKAGDDAPGRAAAAGPFELDVSRGNLPELSAAALLCIGDGRGARRLLEGPAQAEQALPGLLLQHARSLGKSDDVPEIKRIERARTAYARALKGWPTSWEAAIGNAVYSAARKGPGEGRVETLRDLAKLRAERQGPPDLLVRAFEGATAMEVGLRDVALASFEELKEPLKGTPLLAALDDRVHPRVGAEAEAFFCTGPMVDRQAVSCLQQKARRGDSKGVFAEIARLRELRGSPRALWQNELSQRFADGDAKGSLAMYDALLPGERSLAMLGIAGPGHEGELRGRLDRDRATARDAPGSVASIVRLLGDDPAPALEAEAAKVIAADRASSGATSATLVLMHDERYSISPDGLMRSITHDVRRVAGTTDVDQGAGGASFSVVGRELRRVLRRRVHKKDGRVLEPDRAAQAAQGNADLSQLEPGDYIEQIVEGFALPDRAGHLVVDTPDLLPERTSIRSASIEISYPKGVKLARWGHALLGKPEEHDAGPLHVVRYSLKNAPPRRIEDGAPRMDRDVAVSFGTYTWQDVARHLGEQVRAMVDDDPFVTRWAREAAGAGAIDRAAVERVVSAAGKSIKVAQGVLLSDTAASLLAGPQRETARHILELGQGSRTWVIYRALTVLGVKTDLVVAEREPFSADPSFPARPARFDRPLLIAHLPDGDAWIDADIVGPPLPAGRVSPELRGRSALTLTGEMIPVQGASAEGARDEIDIRQKVDARGDAAGTFTIMLRGRPAQGLAEALERVVGTDRREMLRGVVLGWLPWANVNDVALSSSEGSWEVSLKAEIAIPSFAQGEGKAWVLPGLEPLHAVFPRAAVSTVGATYATRMGRQSALSIESAFQYHVKRRIELPDGAHVSGALPQVQVKHEHLEASRQGRAVDRAVEEEFTLSISTGTVAADAYERFAHEAKRLDDGFLAGTRVSR